MFVLHKSIHSHTFLRQFIYLAACKTVQQFIGNNFLPIANELVHLPILEHSIINFGDLEVDQSTEYSMIRLAWLLTDPYWFQQGKDYPLSCWNSVISLCHQYRAKSACTSVQSNQGLYYWLINFKFSSLYF